MAESYDELLLKFKPRPIRNARDHARVLRQVDEIMRLGPQLPKAASEIVEVLSTLIEDYESTEFPMPTFPRRKCRPV